MKGPSLFLLLLFFVTSVKNSDIGADNITQLQTIDGNLLSDLSNLEDTMKALNALSASQKQLLEQQRAREERILAQNKEDQERELARSRSLEAEQKLLEEIRGKVYRKINVLNRRTKLKNITQGEMTLANAPKDCSDVYLAGDEASGVYRIWPIWSRDKTGFLVYCDMDTDGGGWTVLHRWSYPTVPVEYFARTWKDYKNGFGDLETAFWLGNERIYELTSQGVYDFRFDTETNGDKSFSTYGHFFIGGEDVYYKLHIGKYRRDGIADVFQASNGANFSTFDHNNMPIAREQKTDPYGYYDSIQIKYYLPKCSEVDVGWWYKSTCTLDLKIHPTTNQELSKTEMKIRHGSFTKKKESPP